MCHFNLGNDISHIILKFIFSSYIYITKYFYNNIMCVMTVNSREQIKVNK